VPNHSEATLTALAARAAQHKAQSCDDSDLERYSSELARSLLQESHTLRSHSERKRERLLGRLMADTTGQAFTTCLTDRAYRSQNPERIVTVARQLLRDLGVPSYLPAEARALLHLLLRAGPFAPQLAARGVLQRLHAETRTVVLSAQEPDLREHLARRRAEGAAVNLNYLGEAVLGEREAEARCRAYASLLARSDVQAISIKLSSIASRTEPLAYRETLDELKPRVREIYRTALAHGAPWPDGSTRPKLVSLDMESYRDLQMTFDLFVELMSEPELDALQACLVLQAYLPDSHAYQRELTRVALARVQRGGAPLRMRIVKGANLAAERVESAARGWPLPIFDQKVAVDANYKRMLEYACQPEHARALHLGVASHNLFDIGFALTLRTLNGLDREVSFELLEGMADPLRRALQAAGQHVLLYCPIVPEGGMQSAIAYLMRRLDENTAQDNFLRSSFGMQVSDASFEREQQRFAAALVLRHTLPDTPRRTQDRSHTAHANDCEAPPHVSREFVNEPDTDFALPQNREYLRGLLDQHRTLPCFDVPMQIGGESVLLPQLQAGFDPSRPEVCPYRYPLALAAELERALATAAAAAPRCAAVSVNERAAWLKQIARGLRKARGSLICAMLLDAGKRIDQADAEVSEAIDFAEYYARSYCEHARHAQYRLSPRGPVLVTPPWNFPLAIPASGTLAALMAGNPVILKPALETIWVAARLVEVCHAAGVPRDMLQLVFCADELGSRLIADTRIANVVLTGATSTARKFFELRPDIALLAETGGKNSVIVSELADRDLAIKEALASAFGHAGQKCSAASLLICLPEVHDDPAFMEVLRDATESLPVGSAWDPRSVVTPLIQPPSGALARALSTLEAGESFLVAPRLDPNNPRLVGPCIKVGLTPGGFSHMTELFGPVLGVLRANDFDHAIELANASPYGLTAGLFSLDEREQARWTARMAAGNLYINRGVTGAVVRRQPFGGWKASSFGPGAKAGGPNYVLQLSDWHDGSPERPVEAPDPAAARLLASIRDQLDQSGKERLALGACHYAQAFRNHFKQNHDPSAIQGESNVFRYVPCAHMTLRCGADADFATAMLACLAALSAGVAPLVSRPPSLVWPVATLPGCDSLVETDDVLCERIRSGAVERVRHIGSLPDKTRAVAADSGVHIASGPVLLAGRLELLHYLREQAVSNAYHRYGSLHAAPLLTRADPRRRASGSAL
jgi:RHH-type proline utilization regulon transcriptional repressor/proline dehydrogenase/delta 1-pyrroline-5-carboxylate dehydrogenase